MDKFSRQKAFAKLPQGDYDEAIFMFGHHHNISEKYDGNERDSLLFGEDIDRGLVTEAGWC
ncbi:hypothetical protein AAG906_027866 [Vitis piasezkii]